LSTLLLTHPACLDHAVMPGHPERPDRLRAIHAILDHERFATLIREEAPLGLHEAVLLVHPQPHLDRLEEASPQTDFAMLDADTTLSPGSLEAALRGVGAATLAVDTVLRGTARNAFCAIRPPGHHAETSRPMGFCLFNNAAIAARHAQAVHGVERVAIVDFDVHHGNGTQEIFWRDASVLYASTHEMPLYPGTGARSETGEHGTIINAPLRAGNGGDLFREAFETAILPRLHDFAPDLVIISAGFDAHWRDPLASLNLVEADFEWATRRLMGIANRHAGGRLISLLEGGYDLEGLSKSVGAHVGALMSD
jgi:acetoin utilization deacetylase AcuC-like enzyme